MPAARRLAVLTGAALLVAAGAPSVLARERPVTLRIPSFTVPPRSDREVKTAFRIPRRAALDIAGMVIRNRGASGGFSTHHFLAYVYRGEFGAALEAGRRRAWDLAQFPHVSDTEELLIGGAQTIRKRQIAPAGLALKLDPIPRQAGSRRSDVWIILDSHWVNGSDRTRRGSVVVKLVPARRPIKRYLKPIFEVSANAALAVAPRAVGSTETSTAKLNQFLAAVHQPTLPDAWGPGILGLEPYGVQIGGALIPKSAVCVTLITAHMHKRGTLFAVDYIDADGMVKNGIPSPSLENPYEPGRYHFFVSRDYDDPAEYEFDPPRLMTPGQRFHYACWHDNGVVDPVKLGCEEQAGTTPGQSIADEVLGRGSGAPRPCYQAGPNPEACPPGEGFTGNCVESNLVFGYTADDDMCILPGAYYDANVEAPPGHECDLEILAPLG
jgi:hypothetical protein